MRSLEGEGKKFRNQEIKDSFEREKKELLKGKKIEKNRKELVEL